MQGNEESVIGPSWSEADEALRSAQRLEARSRRMVMGQVAGSQIVLWGGVWALGYTEAQFLPLAAASVVWLLLMLVGGLVSALLRRGREVSSGWEARFGRGWWALVLGSFAVVAIVEPTSAQVVFLVLGALWGIGFVLYALIAGDVPLVVLGAAVVVVAPTLRILIPQWSLLGVGVLAGGSMMGFGLWRSRALR
jgi:hypothetical protein